jgi:hypothetical protein
VARIKNITISIPKPEFSRLETLQNQVLADIGDFRGADRLGRGELHLRGGQDYAGVSVQTPFQPSA